MLKGSMEQCRIAIFATLNNSKFSISTNLNASAPCSISVSPLKIPKNSHAPLAITSVSLANLSTNVSHATACIWTHSGSSKLKNPNAFVRLGITMMDKITSNVWNVMKAVWHAKAPLYLTAKHVQKAGHVELMEIVFVRITFKKRMELVFANPQILITWISVLHFRTKISVLRMKFKSSLMEHRDVNASKTICSLGQYAFYAIKTKELTIRLVNAYVRTGITKTTQRTCAYNVQRIRFTMRS